MGTNDGTDHGKLTEVKQFYQQDGRTIEHPSYIVNGNQHNTITDDFCGDWVAVTQDGTNFLEKGGLDAVEKAIDAGVVLVMSLWDDHYANMLWLDSTYPVGSTDPGTMRGNCGADSGVPKDVESAQANAHVIFSDIKFGPIGSTTDSTPTPSPTPPAPSPTPPAPTPTPTPTPDPTPGDCPGGSLIACIDLCPSDIFAACSESCHHRCPSMLV